MIQQPHTYTIISLKFTVIVLCCSKYFLFWDQDQLLSYWMMYSIFVLNNPNVPPQLTIMCVGTEGSRDLEFHSNSIILPNPINPGIYQSAIVTYSVVLYEMQLWWPYVISPAYLMKLLYIFVSPCSLLNLLHFLFL